MRSPSLSGAATPTGGAWRRKASILACSTLLLVSTLPVPSRAETAAPVVPLWQQGAPGFENRRQEPELAQDWWVKNVHNPSLTVFLPPPERATGAAVVVAPGGGYRELVFTAEGKQTAEFLNRLGVAAFVLKYRLPNEPGSPYTMDHVRQDARRAMRLVRSRARQWHLDEHRVGMLGFSAGGDLVGQIAYVPGQGDPKAPDPIDRLDARPDFQILIYPGGTLPDTLPADAPPTFLLVANDDDGSAKTSLELFTKLRAAHVSVEAHFLARGQHAFNMGDRSSFASVRGWPDRLADWLKDSGYLTPPAPKH